MLFRCVCMCRGKESHMQICMQARGGATVKCPEGGCSAFGKIKNIFPCGGGATGVIWCELWRDVSWHPISGGRECPKQDTDTDGKRVEVRG